MDIPVNAEVRCTDGPGGESEYIVLKPKTEEVTHLVVREKGFPHIERPVPVSMVAESTPHLIRLGCTREELAKQPTFFETEFMRVEIPRSTGGGFLMPVGEWEPEWLPVRHEVVPWGEVAVRRGAHVVATDGRVGQVDELLVNPTNEQITHLVLREGHLWGQRDVTIPASAIDRIEQDTIYLKLDKRSIGALPTVPIRRRMAQE
jgi:sporulation protein YlmC with PRC-barrel domain